MNAVDVAVRPVAAACWWPASALTRLPVFGIVAAGRRRRRPQQCHDDPCQRGAKLAGSYFTLDLTATKPERALVRTPSRSECG
jgi:hypothetical protein